MRKKRRVRLFHLFFARSLSSLNSFKQRFWHVFARRRFNSITSYFVMLYAIVCHRRRYFFYILKVCTCVRACVRRETISCTVDQYCSTKKTPFVRLNIIIEIGLNKTKQSTKKRASLICPTLFA